MNNLKLTLEANGKPGIVNKIRPKIILQQIENTISKPVEMKLNIPSSQIGSLTTLEATMMIALMKLTDPKAIFEFGTFLGYSTSLFLKNSNKKCTVYSIDLGEIEMKQEENTFNMDTVLSNDIINDDFLRSIQSTKGAFYIKDDIDNKNPKLQLLFGDSTKFSVSEKNLKNAIEFIFIDGGHTFNIVQSDTNKAFEMVESGVILWHDYNSKIHSDVTDFVDSLAKERMIFHIEHTMLAFTII